MWRQNRSRWKELWVNPEEPQKNGIQRLSVSTWIYLWRQFVQTSCIFWHMYVDKLIHSLLLDSFDLNTVCSVWLVSICLTIKIKHTGLNEITRLASLNHRNWDTSEPETQGMHLRLTWLQLNDTMNVFTYICFTYTPVVEQRGKNRK